MRGKCSQEYKLIQWIKMVKLSEVNLWKDFSNRSKAISQGKQGPSRELRDKSMDL